MNWNLEIDAKPKHRDRSLEPAWVREAIAVYRSRYTGIFWGRKCRYWWTGGDKVLIWSPDGQWCFELMRVADGEEA